MLTIWLAVCALTMLAALADAACSAATTNSAGRGIQGLLVVARGFPSLTH
jgi:hypothetical protein